MKIFYEFDCQSYEFGFFLDFYAKKSGIKYKLYKKDSIFVLALDDSDDKVLDFNDNYLKNVPYFLSFKGYLIKDDYDLIGFETFVATKGIDTKKLTPFYHQNGFSEFDQTPSKDIQSLKTKLLDGKTITIDNYTLSTQKNFSQNVVIANYNLLKKAFIIQKHHQIHLNAYENPFLKLKPKDIYKSYHNLEDKIFVGFCPSIDIYHIIKDFDDLVYIQGKILKIISLDDGFVSLDDDFTSYANVFDIDTFKVSLPKSLDGLKKMFLDDTTSQKLLSNYELKHSFNDNFPKLNDDFISLFDLLGYILELDIIDTFEKTSFIKAPRIDFVFIDGKFNAKKTISSVLSFVLAGVDKKIICCGIIESFIYFLDRYKDELKYDKMVVCGEFFESEKIILLLKKISSAKIFYKKLKK